MKGAVLPLPQKGLATPPLTPPESDKPTRPLPDTNTLSLTSAPEPPSPVSSVQESVAVPEEAPKSPPAADNAKAKPATASPRADPIDLPPMVPQALQMTLFDDEPPTPTLPLRPRAFSIVDPVSIMVTPSSATPSFSSNKTPKASPLSDEFTNLPQRGTLAPSFPPSSFVSTPYPPTPPPKRAEPRPEPRPEPPEPASSASSASSTTTNSPRIRPMSSTGSLSHHWWQLGSRSRRASAPVL